MRVQDNNRADSYFEIKDLTDQTMFLTKISGNGNANVFFNPIPLNGSGGASVGFFRLTDSTGLKGFTFYRGNNTSQRSAFIGVDGADSYVQIHGGKLGVGTQAPTEALHVTGAARFDSGITYIPPMGDLSMGIFTNAP